MIVPHGTIDRTGNETAAVSARAGGLVCEGVERFEARDEVLATGCVVGFEVKGLLNKLGALSRARSWGNWRSLLEGVLSTGSSTSCRAFPFSGIRVVFFTDRSGGDVEAANRGRIVSYDEEYMILSAPDVDKLDPAEPPTALAGCYYAGSTSRTPVSVLKPSNALRFGVFQKATAAFFLFRDLVPCLPYAGCAISNSLAPVSQLLGPKVLPAPDTSSEYFGPASNFPFGRDIQKSSGGLRFVQRNKNGCFLRRFLGYEILRRTIFDRDGRESAKFERENSDIPYFTSFPSLRPWSRGLGRCGRWSPGRSRVGSCGRGRVGSCGRVGRGVGGRGAGGRGAGSAPAEIRQQ
ncbi:hypothetical protein C8R47DRAFT_1080979 [Mycena vitilis]|nr:hypothetical protein C8R47DRAFT_1080979 [Mycena vitilis]